jgi:hypothetical protein
MRPADSLTSGGIPQGGKQTAAPEPLDAPEIVIVDPAVAAWLWAVSGAGLFEHPLPHSGGIR